MFFISFSNLSSSPTHFVKCEGQNHTFQKVNCLACSWSLRHQLFTQRVSLFDGVNHIFPCLVASHIDMSSCCVYTWFEKEKFMHEFLFSTTKSHLVCFMITFKDMVWIVYNILFRIPSVTNVTEYQINHCLSSKKKYVLCYWISGGAGGSIIIWWLSDIFKQTDLTSLSAGFPGKLAIVCFMVARWLPEF